MQKLIVTLVLVAGLLAGCSTVNPDTGKKEFDPVKTEQVRAAIEPLAASAVRRVVLKNPDTANYLRAVGAVFCSMKETKTFSPAELAKALSALAPPPKNTDVADVVNLMFALYSIQFGNRFKAELPPDQWVYQLSVLFCDSINRGLADAALTVP